MRFLFFHQALICWYLLAKVSFPNTEKKLSKSTIFPNCDKLKDLELKTEIKKDKNINENLLNKISAENEKDIYPFIEILQKIFLKLYKQSISLNPNKENFISLLPILPEENLFSLLDQKDIIMNNQQDIHEILIIIIDYLSKLFPDEISKNLITVYQTEITCESQNYHSTREEDFCVISLDIEGKTQKMENNNPAANNLETTIEECIEDLTKTEVLDGENALLINNQKCAVNKKINLEKIAPILFIHLKRFKNTNGNKRIPV